MKVGNKKLATCLMVKMKVCKIVLLGKTAIGQNESEQNCRLGKNVSSGKNEIGEKFW